MLLWEMYTFGETPYEGWDNVSLFQRLENGERLHQPRVRELYKSVTCEENDL